MNPPIVRRMPLVLATMFAALHPSFARAQQAAPRDTVVALSLEDALRLVSQTSEQVRIATAGAERARGTQMVARSAMLPQLNATAAYQRTLKSQFEGAFKSAPPDTTRPAPPAGGSCDAYLKDSSAPTDQQLAGLDSAVQCQNRSGGIGSLFSNLPFGQKNQYSVGLTFSQPIFAGGRLIAQTRAASAGRRAAEIGLTSAVAQSKLDVVQAYYDAALSDQLAQIADSTLVQTENVLKQVSLQHNVGDLSDFEQLRAQVTRDNQVPVVIQRHADRDVAFLRLKQLLNLPLGDSLVLTTLIDDSTTALPVADVSYAADSTPIVPSADDRAPVRQAHEAMKADESLLRAAHGARLPAISLTSTYNRLAYPLSGLPDWSSMRTDWTVGVGMQLPLFTGGRLRGDEIIAKANLNEARAQYDQVRELAELDTRVALSNLGQARAAWLASAGTAGQAQRAYHIAEVRYKEGISTQTELSESRVLLQQSLANRALAARNLQVARVRLALLRDLPLSGGGFSTQGTSGASGFSSPQGAGSAPQVPQQSQGGAQTQATQTSF